MLTRKKRKYGTHGILAVVFVASISTLGCSYLYQPKIVTLQIKDSGYCWYNPECTLQQAVQDCRESLSLARAQAMGNSIQRGQDRIIVGIEQDKTLERHKRRLDVESLFHYELRKRGYRRVRPESLGADVDVWGVTVFGQREYVAGKYDNDTSI